MESSTQESGPSPNSFEGQVALITGASRGIGKALAVELGARGAKVACAARATSANPLSLPGTVDETVDIISSAGGDALAVPTDLSLPEEIAAMVQTTVGHFGGLDILVNNAAVTFPGDIDIQPKHYDLIMNINVRAPLLASHYAHPHLIENGRILNVSSAVSQSYFPSMMVYGMSKAALDHLTISTAAQFQKDSIAVNCFRINTQVLSEGYMSNAPDEDHSAWVPAETAAKGMCWMLEQPLTYTGQIEDMLDMGEKIDVMGEVDKRERLQSDWNVG